MKLGEASSQGKGPKVAQPPPRLLVSRGSCLAVSSLGAQPQVPTDEERDLELGAWGWAALTLAWGPSGQGLPS